MPFADRFKAERDARGLNQTEAASQLGVTQGTVSRWEDGASPDGEQVVRICDRWGRTADYWLRGKHLLGDASLDEARAAGYREGLAKARRMIEALEATPGDVEDPIADAVDEVKRPPLPPAAQPRPRGKRRPG